MQFRPNDTPTVDIADLKDTLNTSSEINRNLGLFFVGFLILVASLVNSITDMDLLKNDQLIQLPFLDIEIGIINFAYIGPFLVLGLHLNLLVNLSEHTSKLVDYIVLKGKQKNIVKKELHPFIYNHSVFKLVNLLQVEVSIPQLLSFLVEIVLPLGALYYFQYRFTDLHDPSLTFYQTLIFRADLILCIIFHTIILFKVEKIFKKENLVIQQSSTDEMSLYKSIRIFVNELSTSLRDLFLPDARLIENFFSSFFKYFMEIAFGIGVIIPLVVHSNLNNDIVKLISDDDKYNEASYIFDEKYRDSITYPKYNVLLIKPNLSFNGEDIYKSRPSEDAFLSLKDSVTEKRIELTVGINLKQRDLKFAEFRRCKLFNAIFEGTNTTLAF